MYKLTVTNEAGNDLMLTHNPDYTVTSITGLNPPKAEISYSASGTKDGGVLDLARIVSRNIVLTILPSLPVERNRIALYAFFKIKKPVTVAFKNGARDVKIEGYVESVEVNLFSQQQTIQVSIICLQPYWKSAQTIVDELSQILDAFEFPFATPDGGIVFSEINKTAQTVVTNNGEAETGVIIEIFAEGSVSKPVIYNSTTNESLSLSIDMQYGDLIRINTIRGQKSIFLTRSGKSANIINYLVAGSTWFSIPQGETVFAYNASSGSENMDIKIYHDDMFEGV